MDKPILCVDFDGVIHIYTSPWTNTTTISDGAVPGALCWLWKATEWFNVQIYSSRSKTDMGRAAMERWMMDEAKKEWPDDDEMVRRFMAAMRFCHEKPAAFLTIDDRAICFEGDWSAFDPAALRDFKPWNKRPKLGATGSFPDGKLGPHDEGALQMEIRNDGKYVHLAFGKSVAWLALPPGEAKELAALIMHHATQCQQMKN